MKFIAAVSALAALAIGQAAAGTLNHRHFHMRRDAHAQPKPVEVSKRSVLSSAATTLLSSLPVLTGANAVANNGQAWLGDDGTYTNTFINNSTEEVVLVVWGPAGSWVNAIAPLITVSIPSGSEQCVSFANGASGAFAAVYPDTKSVNGQISQTWGEYTFDGIYSTVDVSREVNMNGKPVTIVTPQCTSSFSQCVFQCTGDVTSCEFGYELFNCATGSQPGAEYGEYYGAPSGGCGGMGDSAALTTTFG